MVTREVNIGGVPLGGNNPIRVQSMTNTDTLDTEATIAQCIRMIEAGCEYVRITAPGIREAENLKLIRKGLHQRGYHTPLIADVHFNPKVAELAAQYVEKVRINPGNYTDRKTGKLEFTESEYQAEIDKIRKRLHPLIAICKTNGTAMRIGSNHGSLSERIMSRYGDTPMGMAIAAMEFINICEDLSFHDLVISMKASNPRVMIEATRLIVALMQANGECYPLHLGVTEAGDAAEGRIKSATGICSLLEDGVGDTIRVSLTEDPEKEIPAALQMTGRYNNRLHSTAAEKAIPCLDPFTFHRRSSRVSGSIGGHNLPVVISSFPEKLDAPVQPDFVETDSPEEHLPLFNKFVTLVQPALPTEEMSASLAGRSTVLIAQANGDDAPKWYRAVFSTLATLNQDIPVILKKHYTTSNPEEFLIQSAADTGTLLADGLGDGIWLEADAPDIRAILVETAFSILQATRSRVSRTEFISCPSCGRTQYNILEALAKVKEATRHLKGLKIAVMGCIVNGPGEMADADYGYVGAGRGKVTLYRGKEPVIRNIDQEEAVQMLIRLIQKDGRWIEARA
ncbi:MAG: (E)-4-hydroxy-3-methylbut-2-enyl-diphosphate synthase [Bacteroidota bacterium]|nr:(E)-4-hydroxy-3-methylbut-2-enyl-diphosphate synthase [Bacteroidota bacterium]